MKVLISDKIADQAIEELKKIDKYDIDVNTDLSPEELKNEIKNYDAIVVRSATKLREDTLEKAENLKVIVRAGIGLDNIDLDKAEELGIKVFNTPSATSITVAEYTIGLMFAAARHIPNAYKSMKEHKWEKKQFKGTELYGKTHGIIGFGRIGREVAKRALALGMNVICHDICEIKTDLSVKDECKEDLLKHSDYISLHLPLTKDTKDLITKKELDMMKDDAVLINVARGGVVNEKDLYDTLNKNKLRAAVIDVHATEPPKDFSLIDHPRVIPLPHIGAAAAEGQVRAGLEVVEKLNDFFNK